MAGTVPPPRKPKPSTEAPRRVQSPEDQLVEIARAQAVLERRDPTQAGQVIKAQLVHQASEPERQRRLAAFREAAEKARIRARKRRIRVAVVAGVVAVGTVPVAMMLRTETDHASTLAARIEGLAQPVTAIGFQEVRRWLGVSREGVTFEVPPGTCTALVAARDDRPDAVPFEVERNDGTKVAAQAGVVWCSCEAEKVTVRLAEAGTARRALSRMSAAWAVSGGLEVLATRPLGSFRLVTDPGAEACSGAAFNAWAQVAGHGDVDPLEATRPGPTADLVADGFEPAGLFAADRPFAVLRATKGRCYLAASETGRSPFSVVGPDGTPLVTPAAGAAVLCTHAGDAAFTLRRADRSGAAVAVVGAPADRAGGLAGVRAAALRHGLRDVAVALLPDELSQDARASLAAATVPAASIQESDASGLPGQTEASVVAFTLRGKAAMLPEPGPTVPTGCQPDLDAAAPLRALVCAEARPQKWRPGGDPKQHGGAEGPRPFWLSLFAGGDEAAQRATATLMLFAQRMTLLGYEPTTSDGVKDTPEGAVVSGWAGHGDVVAVGLTLVKPWLVPLSDGPRWSLDGPLQVLHIPTGTTKKLHGDVRLAADAKARRVVVWRR